MQVDSNCPYGCSDGKVFDSVDKRFVPCPHCSKLLSDMANGVFSPSSSVENVDINNLLKIPKRYVPKEFNLEYLIRDFYAMEWESITGILEVMQEILDLARVSDTLSYSVVFDLGSNSDMLNFAFNYMRVALISGLSVCPVVSVSDVYALRCGTEGDDSVDSLPIRKYLEVSYDDLVSRDVCIVSVDSGSTKYSPMIVTGLMQARERKGLSTIVFAHDNRMARYYSKMKSLHTMYPYTVKYIASSTGFTFDFPSYINLIVKLLKDGIFCIDSYLEGNQTFRDKFTSMCKDFEGYKLRLSNTKLSSRYSTSDLRDMCESFVSKLSIYAKYRVSNSDSIDIGKFSAYLNGVSELHNSIKLEVNKYLNSGNESNSSLYTNMNSSDSNIHNTGFSTSNQGSSVNVLEMQKLGRKGNL